STRSLQGASAAIQQALRQERSALAFPSKISVIKFKSRQLSAFRPNCRTLTAINGEDHKQPIFRSNTTKEHCHEPPQSIPPVPRPAGRRSRLQLGGHGGRAVQLAVH